MISPRRPALCEPQFSARPRFLPRTLKREGIYQVFHILNNFDIPVGVAQEKDDKGKIHKTILCSPSPTTPQNLRYYWRTYNDQAIKMVDLKKIDLTGNKIKKSTPRANSGLRI